MTTTQRRKPSENGTSVREELDEILDRILPDDPAQALTGTALLEMLKGEDIKGSDATFRYHFSIMSGNPGSSIAKVEGRQGYYRRPEAERVNGKVNAQRGATIRTAFQLVRLLDDREPEGAGGRLAFATRKAALMTELEGAEPEIWAEILENGTDQPPVDATQACEDATGAAFGGSGSPATVPGA